MRSGLEELAYMNDDGTLYLLLEDTVYAIDVNMGKMDVATKTQQQQLYSIGRRHFCYV